MKLGRKIQIILLCLSFLIFFYSYYYLPGKNEGSIKVENLPSKETEEGIKNKNTFTNVEYKSQNNQGQIFTTKAKESFLNLSKPDLVNLVDPYSVTKLKKDNSLIEIRSEIGMFDEKKNIVIYKKKCNYKK
jgi:hypothetical protein